MAYNYASMLRDYAQRTGLNPVTNLPFQGTVSQQLMSDYTAQINETKKEIARFQHQIATFQAIPNPTASDLRILEDSKASLTTLQSYLASVTAQLANVPNMVDVTAEKTNREDPNGFTWAILNKSGVFLLGFEPMQLNYAFQYESAMPFSPLNKELISADNALLLFLMWKLSKDPKALASVINAYMQSTVKIFEAIEDNAGANWTNHGNSTMLAAAFLHSRGLLNNAGVVRVQEHVRSTFDKLYVKDAALGALGGVTTLINGSRTNVTEKSTDEGITLNSSQGGLAALAGLVAKAPV